VGGPWRATADLVRGRVFTMHYRYVHYSDVCRHAARWCVAVCCGVLRSVAVSCGESIFQAVNRICTQVFMVMWEAVNTNTMNHERKKTNANHTVALLCLVCGCACVCAYVLVCTCVCVCAFVRMGVCVCRSIWVCV